MQELENGVRVRIREGAESSFGRVDSSYFGAVATVRGFDLESNDILLIVGGVRVWVNASYLEFIPEYFQGDAVTCTLRDNPLFGVELTVVSTCGKDVHVSRNGGDGSVVAVLKDSQVEYWSSDWKPEFGEGDEVLFEDNVWCVREVGKSSDNPRVYSIQRIIGGRLWRQSAYERELKPVPFVEETLDIVVGWSKIDRVLTTLGYADDSEEYRSMLSIFTLANHLKD